MQTFTKYHILATVLLTAACASTQAQSAPANLCGSKVTQVEIEQDEGHYKYPMTLRPDEGANGEIADNIWTNSLREQNPTTLTLHCIFADQSVKEVDITGATLVKWDIAKGIVTKK